MGFREKVIGCLGRFPGRGELSAKVISSEDKGSHILQQVSYSTEEIESINAWLLIPGQLKDKNPAIIASHQHNGEYFLGKSEPAGLSSNSMYHYGLDLCLRGYVVLCPDHLGFEDRRPEKFKKAENQWLEGHFYESFLFTGCIAKGTTLQAKYLSDLCRGIDFLETLDFVDSDRIGAIGHSLGGQETLWLSWFDPRIKAAVSSCGFGQLSTILRDGINHNYAMYTFGLLNFCDVGDIVCDMAPKPFLMTNGTKDDIFPIDGIREIAAAAKSAYKAAGAGDNYRAVIFEGEHSFPGEVKEEAYKFLDKYLK